MTRTLVTAIVSTAAPGAESGALDAAIELGIGHGVRTPAAELPPIYAGRMRGVADRGMAVRLNVQDSDGTLLISFADQLTGRTKHAGDQCKAQRKPARHLILPAGSRTRIRDSVRTALLKWIDDNHISVLHVVGADEEQEPGIAEATRDALVWVLEDDVADSPVAPQQNGEWWWPSRSVVSAVDAEAGTVTIGTERINPSPLPACDHIAGSCIECSATICIHCLKPVPFDPRVGIKTAVRYCRSHAYLDPGSPQICAATADVLRATERHGVQGDPATAPLAAHETALGCAPFRGVDRSASPESLQHAAEPMSLAEALPLAVERIRRYDLARSVDATGALTTERRIELEASIRQAEVEIAASPPWVNDERVRARPDLGVDCMEMRIGSYANVVQHGPTAGIDCSDMTDEQFAAMQTGLEDES